MSEFEPETRPPVPPFDKETATKKVKAAQRLWNTCDPAKVSLAYTRDTIWRNRDEFMKGRAETEQFLTRKWAKETRYKLRKELFAWTDNKIAVQFWYEFYDETLQSWFRCYGLEDWTFAPNGYMEKRQMSGNNVQIEESERWFKDGATDEDVDLVNISAKHW